jgi:transcriptional regulator with XRE-family HTH domain
MLGKLAGKSRGAIGHLENGHRKPTIVTLNAIADALGVSPSELTTKGEPNGSAPA